MGRYIGPKNRIARRFGINLGLKTNPTKVARRLTQGPGVHGAKRKSAASGFGKQLLEKQKAKFIYGLREQQFRRVVQEASRQTGDSGVNMMRLLETRLDNVVYRLGFAVTRAQARQFVTHGMFMVNGKKVNIPSYHVKVNEVIGWKENKQKKKIFSILAEQQAHHEPPGWLAVDWNKREGRVLHLPGVGDGEKSFDVRLIIEFYSAR